MGGLSPKPVENPLLITRLHWSRNTPVNKDLLAGYSPVNKDLVAAVLLSIRVYWPEYSGQ